MKQLLIVTLAIRLAVCQSNPPKIQSYDAGNEYVYDYNAQIVTGQPIGTKTYSGLKVVCKAKLQLTDATTVKMQFTGIQIFKLNDEVTVADPAMTMLPTQLFTELNGAEYELIHNHLIKPCQFTYSRGHVTDLKTDSDDPIWSINLKRGLLNMLEINMNERQSLSPEIDPHAADNTPKFFTVVEPSIAGECETDYKMVPIMTPDGHSALDVLKVRNLDKCLDPVPLPKTIMFDAKCKGKCITERNYVTRQSSVRYSLTGTPDRFCVLSAISEGQVSYTHTVERSGRIATFSNQTLVLVDSRRIQQPITGPASPKPQPLCLKADISKDNTAVPRETPVSADEQSLLFEMAKKLLMVLDKYTADKVREEAGPTFLEFYWILHRMNLATFTRFHNMFGKPTASNMNMREIYLDAMATLDTYPAVTTLMTVVKNNELPPARLVKIFMIFSLIPSPDVFAIKAVLDYANSVTSWPTVHVKRTVVLCLGTLAKKMVVTRNTEMYELQKQLELVSQLRLKSNSGVLRRKLGQQAEQIREKIQRAEDVYTSTKETVVELLRKLIQSSDMDDQILAVKAIGNCGFEELFPDCEELIRAAETPSPVKMEAISALMSMITVPDKVFKILLPVYFDRSQPELIRTIAFYTCMKLNPPYPMVEMVAKSLYDEPSLTVGSFVWSFLMETSNRTKDYTKDYPCVYTLARNATLAMRFGRDFMSNGMQYTKYMFREFKNYITHRSLALETMVMNTRERFYPDSMFFNYYSTMFNTYTPILGTGYYMTGDWDESAWRSIPDIITQFLKPQRKQRSVPENVDEMQDIKDKLNVPNKASVAPRGYVYFKALGQEIFYYDIQPSNFQRRQFPPVDISKTLDYLRSYILPYMYHTLPSDTGLPVWMSCSAMVIVKMTGDIQLLPTERQAAPAAPRKWDLTVNLKKSMLWQGFGTMHVELPYYRVGIALKASMSSYVPIKLTMSNDYPKKKFIWKFLNTEEPGVINTKALPYTFIMRLPSDPTHFPAPVDMKEVMFSEGNEIRPIAMTFGKSFGQEIIITGRRVVTLHENAAVCPYNGKNTIRIVMKPKAMPLVFEGQYVSTEYRRQSDSSSSQEEDSQSKGQGWNWQSWLFRDSSSEETTESQPQPEQPFSEEMPYKENRVGSDPSSGFDNLELKDITLETVTEKLKPVTEILPDGTKYGVIFRLAEAGRNPTRQMQLTYLWQEPAARNRMLTAFIFRRSAIPNMDPTPWQMETVMDRTFPAPIEPAALENEAYQREVKHLMNMAFQEDGTTPDWLDNLPDIMIKRANKLFNKFAYLKPLGQNYIAYLISKQSQEPVIQELASVVQKLNRISTMVNGIEKMSAQPLKVVYALPRVYHEVEKIQDIQQTLISKIDAQAGRIDNPEVSFIYYCMVKQKEIIFKLEKIFARIRPICTTEESAKLHQFINQVRQYLKQQKEKQDAKMLTQQPVSPSYTQMSPERQALVNEIQNTQKKLINFSKRLTDTIEQGIAEGHLPSFPVSILSEGKAILAVKKGLVTKLEATLLTNIKMEPALRNKIFETCMLSLVIVKDCNKLIYLSDGETAATSTPWRSDSPIFELRYIRNQLDQTFRDIAVRGAMSVSLEYDTQIDEQSSATDLADLKVLQKCEFKQLQAVHLSKRLPRQIPVQDPSAEEAAWVERIKMAFDLCKEVQETVRSLVQKKIASEVTAVDMNVMIKLIKVIYRQVEVAEKIATCAKQAYKQCVSRKLPMAPEPILEIQNVCEQHRDEALMLGGLCTKSFKKELLASPEQQNRWSAAYKNVISEPEHYQYSVEEPSQLVYLQKSLHRVQSKQLQEESAIRELKNEQMSQESAAMAVLHILLKCEQIQQDIISVKSKLTYEIQRRPQDSSVLYACRLLKECKQKQIEMLRPLIQKASELAPYRPEMSEQLSKAQRLEREIQAMPSLEDSFPEAISEQPSHFQKMPMKLHGAATPNQMQLLVTILFGHDNEEPKKILIKMFGKKSLRQLMWEARQQIPLEVDPLVQQYRAEREQPNDKLANTYPKLMTELNTYRHLHLMLTYPKELISVRWRGWFYNIHEMIKHKFYRQATFMMPNKFNIPNNIEIVSEMKENNNWADLLIRTPYETNMFQSVRVPWLYHCLAEKVGVRTSSIKHLKAFQPSVVTPRCEVRGSTVKTLDGLTINLPAVEQPCGSVLAMECNRNSRFIVMSKPLSSNPAKRFIRVLTDAFKVDIIPETTVVKVWVNGKPVEVSTKTKEIRRDDVVLRLQREGGFYLIALPHLGLVVRYNGAEASIQIPLAKYKSKICGLCGNMDAQSSNDLSGPRGVQYPEEKSFMSTYLIQDQQCDAQRLQAKSEVPKIRLQAAQKKPIYAFKIVEKEISGEPHTCFSKIPVKSCPEGTKPSGVARKSIAFHCVNSNTRQAARLIQLSQVSLKSELARKSVNLHDYVSEPQACISA